MTDNKQPGNKQLGNVNEIELSEVEDRVVADAPPLVDGRDIRLIADVPVNLHVELGQLVLSVAQLYALKAGEVVKLDSEVSQPVKLMFGQQQVAEGLLVAVDDHYGFEITSLADIKT